MREKDWTAGSAAGVDAVRRLDHVRVLIYSHDTFGLGHLRRCRTIAHALVEQFKGVHVLIVTGSPIVGAFEFRARVDSVKVPSVLKHVNGEYTSIDAHIDIEETLELRAALIHHTAQSFQPDIMIVDKEPLGLRGELTRTLTYLKTIGCLLVLGLREVLDSPERLREEWSRKQIPSRVAQLYDEIWVYGPRDFWNPLDGIDLPAAARDRVFYTGFLHRTVPKASSTLRTPLAPGSLVVTSGGGGDGWQLMRDVLAARAEAGAAARPMTLVLGPLMGADHRRDIHARAAGLDGVAIVDFESNMEALLAEAAGVVAMGGYNTFCEILSLDRRALIVPRVEPRREQLIRAKRAAELGLVDMLTPEEAADPRRLAAALQALPLRARPSEVTDVAAALSGLPRICERVMSFAQARGRRNFSLIEGGA